MTDVHKEIHRFKNLQVRDSTSTKPKPYDPIAPVAELIGRKPFAVDLIKFNRVRIYE